MTHAPSHTDGRRLRGERIRAAIIAAARQEMMAGNFRPTAEHLRHIDGFSARSIFQHFGTLETLYLAAVDTHTAHSIVSLLPVDDERRLALTVVLGRRL